MRRTRRPRYMFGFLLVAPIIIAGIAYLAIVGAKPVRAWVEARLAERDKASAQTSVNPAKATKGPDIIVLGSAEATPGTPEKKNGSNSTADPDHRSLAAFADKPSPVAMQFRGLVTRLPEVSAGSLAFSFREETGTKEVALSLSAENGQAAALRGMDPGQSRQATLRLRWTEGENPHIVLDEWISWGYEGNNEETY